MICVPHHNFTSPLPPLTITVPKNKKLQNYYKTTTYTY